MSRSVMRFIAFRTELLAYLFIIFYHVQENDKSVLDLVLVIVMVVILSAGDAVWESQPPAILQSFYGLERRHGQLQDVAVAGMVRAVRDRSCVGGEQVHLHEVHRAAGSAGGGILVCGVSG